MRKAKKKTGSRKKKPAAAKENQGLVLKERLEAEFAQAVKSAKSYVGNPQRLQSLFQEASKVAASTIIYVVNPLDLIPDALPALGFLDDATVLALAVRRSRQTLDDFMAWETA